MTTDLAAVVDPWKDVPPPDSPPGGGPSTFADQVRAETQRIEVRDAARRAATENSAQAQPMPDLVRLDELLAQPDPVARYRVDQLWPAGGRVLLSAAWKSGKTTLRDELIRCLVDGVPFLDRFDVQPVQRVVLIDNELDEATLRRWLRAHLINNPEHVHLASLRGRVASFDITNEAVRARWVQAIGRADVVILDCLRPILDVLGLDESRDAGRFLVAFDALLHEAGVTEGLVIHHMGHSSERARGDSRLRDWPDAEWRIVRERGDELLTEPDPAGRRYFSAYGRDVDLSESALDYDPDTRALRLAGGSRNDTRADAALADVLALLDQNPDGLSGRRVEDALAESEHSQKAIRAALRRGQQLEYLKTMPGPRRATIHHLTAAGASVRSSALPVRQRAASECVSASIEDALHSLDAEPAEVRQPQLGDALTTEEPEAEPDDG